MGSKIGQLIEEFLDRDSRNITRELKRRALRETCDYVEKEMLLVNATFEDRYALLEFAIKETSLDEGLWLEFGVYKGNTIRFIAEKIGPPIYGFDSFDGNPENWRSEYRKGAFALNDIPKFPENIHIVRGRFRDSIPKFLQKHVLPVAFAHIDCDLYSSTKEILDNIGHKLIRGSILVFDEFFNYPGWKHHEFKAFMEFIETSQKKFEYIGYVYRHSQVAIRILS
ncbi:MAG: class I SAM-dependent methyltransferase [Chloroflexota bacterium]